MSYTGIFGSGCGQCRIHNTDFSPNFILFLTGGAGHQVLLSIYYVLQETLVQPGFEGYQMNNRVSRVAQQRRVRSVFDGFRSVLISF